MLLITSIKRLTNISLYGIDSWLPIFGLTATLAFGAILSLPARAEENGKLAGCLSAGRVEQLKQRFKTIQMGKPIDYCNPTNRSYQLFYALDFMDRLQLNGRRVEPPYNQGILSGNWLDWFAKRVHEIYWAPQVSEIEIRNHCNADMIPRAFSYAKTGKIYLCLDLTEPTKTEIVKMVTALIHEARHADPLEGVSHVVCTGGGRPRCDESVESRGAYATELEAFSKIGVSATNLSQATKDYAKESAYRLALSSNFNRTFVPKNTVRMALRSDKKAIYFFDGRQLELYRNDLPAQNVVFKDPYQLSIVLESMNVLSIYLRRVFATAAAWSDEGWPFSPPTRAQFADLYRKTESKLVLDVAAIGPTIEIRGKAGLFSLKSYPVQNLNLPSGNPLYLRGAIDGDDTVEDHQIFVTNDLDQLFVISYNTLGSQILEVANPYPGFTYVRKLGTSTYLLHKNGQLFVRETPQSSIHPVTGLEGMRFTSMTPAFDLNVAWPVELAD